MKRLTRENYFMKMLDVIAERSTCERKQVAAIIEKDGRIISTGYAGSPSGMPHCIDEGCIMEDGHCVATIHAEANAIAFAAKHGIATQGATLYCTYAPCRDCAKLIINSGIVAVKFVMPYSPGPLELLDKAGIFYEML